MLISLSGFTIAGSAFPEYLFRDSTEGIVINTFTGNNNRYFVVIQYPNNKTEVLANRNSWALGKFNSADLQKTLEVAKQRHLAVRLKVAGLQTPLFELFRNIEGLEVLLDSD